jgi:hypothetical protein
MNSFPIGNLAPLTQTFAPPNLPGANLHANMICAYIAEELCLGWLSGPFTQAKDRTLLFITTAGGHERGCSQ